MSDHRSEQPAPISRAAGPVPGYSAAVHVTVAVCSVGRPRELQNSLAAIDRQTRRPDSTLVVARHDDDATIMAARQAGVQVTVVQSEGLALAVQTAICAAAPGVIAFVDDDAVATDDWLQRLISHFDDPAVGAVGGRGNVDGDSQAGGEALAVGLMTRTGRVTGNHHLGHGPPRPSDTVKGANMAVRRDVALRIPLALLVRGTGAQYRNELVLTSAIRRQGLRVVYDPAAQVDHFPAARSDGDGRQLHAGPDRTKCVQRAGRLPGFGVHTDPIAPPLARCVAGDPQPAGLGARRYRRHEKARRGLAPSWGSPTRDRRILAQP